VREFYVAPRGSRREIEGILKRWDWFQTLKRELDLPEPGVLFVPGKHEDLSAEYRVLSALDNGAFQLLKADFDATLVLDAVQIVRWFTRLEEAVERGEFKWFALPDVPVHGRRFVDAGERLERMLLTLRLHYYFLRRYRGTVTPRAVLQGYEVEEYLYSYKLYEIHGILDMVDRVLAVGSVCTRKNSSLTNLASGKGRGTHSDFLDELLRFVPRPVHLFGLHGRFVRKHREHPKLYSSDSGAGGAVCKFEIRDLKRKIGVQTKNREDEYALCHLIQYVRSTRGLDKKAEEAISSLF